MAQDDTPIGEPRDAIMQRVRVGLTGLAAVFLLTLLAASILGMLGQDEPHGGRLANGSIAGNAADPPREPLAELGIAPGGNPTKPTPSAPAAHPAVAVRRAPPPPPPAHR